MRDREQKNQLKLNNKNNYLSHFLQDNLSEPALEQSAILLLRFCVAYLRYLWGRAAGYQPPRHIGERPPDMGVSCELCGHLLSDE